MYLIQFGFFHHGMRQSQLANATARANPSPLAYRQRPAPTPLHRAAAPGQASVRGNLLTSARSPAIPRQVAKPVVSQFRPVANKQRFAERLRIKHPAKQHGDNACFP